MSKSIFFSLIIMLTFSSCSSGHGAKRFLGIPLGYTVWHLYTEEQAKFMYPDEFAVSEEERQKIMQKNQTGLEGISWGVREGCTMESMEKWKNNPIVGMGEPLKKEKLLNSQYSEQWTYPYAIVYFKKNKVANVAFRDNEIKKLKGPVKTDISGVYK